MCAHLIKILYYLRNKEFLKLLFQKKKGTEHWNKRMECENSLSKAKHKNTSAYSDLKLNKFFQVIGFIKF